MIYLVLWILIGLVSYFAGFKILPSKSAITRREVLKNSYLCILGPIVSLCVVITYYDLETKITKWLDEEI